MAVIQLALFVGNTLAQDYRFPAADEHYGYFYPTAYMDEGGRDWGCGSIYYSGHNGSDFGVGSWAGMDAGRAVVAAADGVVVATNDGEYDRCSTADCGEANYVIIEHANGRRTWYWHLKQWTVAVSPGQAVSCGTHLGYVGSSGNSTGPHLHFEVREASGSPGDPFYGSCSAPPTYWISQGDYAGLPGNSCPYTGPCTQVATLSCGQTISTANNAGGSTATHSVYGCGEYTWSGSEIAFAFTTSVSEPVSIGITGLGADLDLFLLTSEACDGSGAVTCSTNSDASDEWVSFDASAGAVYTVVVDGWEGAVSGFNLTTSCTGGVTPGGEDTSPVVDTSPVDSAGTDSAIGPPVGGRPGSAVRLDALGCTCATDSGPAGAAGAVLAALALAGRRRRKAV
jgi:MYXO-CTERM domain-containing protein